MLRLFKPVARPQMPTLQAPTITERRLKLREAMVGCTHDEAQHLAYLAMSLLPVRQRELLVQQVDRELWMERKP